MTSSESDSPTSSVESSPNALPRCLPNHILKNLPPSQQFVRVISDSESDSDGSSRQEPSSYYVSPSKPDKRRHLSIQSPRIERLSIVGLGARRRFKPSIPGYGEGIRRARRISDNSPNSALQGQQVEVGLDGESGGAIEISEFGLRSVVRGLHHDQAVGLKSPETALSRRTVGKCVQRLFQSSPVSGGIEVNPSTSPIISPRPTPRRHLMPSPPMRRLQVSRKGLSSVRVMYREPRIPVVLSGDSSSEMDEESNHEAEDQLDENRIIAQVVTECAGTGDLENSCSHLFASPRNSSSENSDACVRDIQNRSRVSFQDREKLKEPSKKEKGRICRKDNVTSKNLNRDKMKEVFHYPCCDQFCLRAFGFLEVKKQRTYYFGLSYQEKNVLLRGCVKSSPTGASGYIVDGRPCCRKGFKKLFSIGNNRLQRISQNLFSRIRNDTVCREKSTTHLTLVHWLNDFFGTNVESLPNKDVFHLPDNWTKAEVFDAFQTEAIGRGEPGITYSWFIRIWNKEFPRVRIPKRSRFSTCGPCTEFKALRDKATLEVEKSECGNSEIFIADPIWDALSFHACDAKYEWEVR